MSAHELIERCRAAGLSLRLEGGQPRLSGQAEGRDELVEALRADRAGVIAELEVEAAKAEAASLAETVKHLDEAVEIVWSEITRLWTWVPREIEEVESDD